MRTNVTGVLRDLEARLLPHQADRISTTAPASASIGPSVERCNPGIPSGVEVIAMGRWSMFRTFKV